MSADASEPQSSIESALAALRGQFAARFAAAATEQVLRDENAKVLGKKGELTAILKQMGGVRFTATMLPGGRIEITQSPGQSESVPICVLKNELRHKVPLTQACKLEVQLEEGTIALPDEGATD